MKTSNTEPRQTGKLTPENPRFGNERWGGLILWYVILNVVLFGGMILAGWFAWTSGIIPGTR